MPNNLLASGVYGCVFNPAYHCNGKTTHKKKLVSKLTKDDITSKNEIDISNRIKGIPNYKKYFIVVESSCPVNRKNLKASSMTNQCELTEKNSELKKKYVLLYSNYIESLELADYLSVNKHITMYSIVKIFIDVMERIDMMSKYKIIHNDLHFGNILRSKETGHIYIIDFGLSICTEYYYKDGTLDHEYIREAVSYYLASWNWHSVEHHLLSYIYYVGDLTDKSIKETIREYLDNHRIIPYISPTFSKEYEKASYSYFSKYAGMPRDEAIQELLSFSHTWDYFKISLHFLKIMNNLQIDNEMFRLFLITMISPNPEKRPTLLQKHRMISQLIEYLPLISESKPENKIVTN